jgi:hypothetical protein
LVAAKLAIKHTQLYFDNIRSRVGDAEYARFLKLAPSDNLLNYINQFVPICSDIKLYPTLALLLGSCAFSLLTFF